jgi:indole-3-glycerol phosphate synthase
MTDFLNEVVVRTKQRVETQKNRFPLSQIRKRFDELPPVQSLSKALHKDHAINVIAELKQASPSVGLIRTEGDIPGRIHGYTQGGAAALSILTEEHYFHGSPQLLELARRETKLPLLRKDFIIDPYQIEESRSLGADALLLITTLLTDVELKDFIALTRSINLEPLVEIHDKKDLERAIYAGATLIGVNNRNLRTLRVDVATAEALVPQIPKQGVTIVIESGIKDPSELQRFQKWGAHAVLIGETLMRNPDPEQAVRSFVQAGQTELKS